MAIFHCSRPAAAAVPVPAWRAPSQPSLRGPALEAANASAYRFLTPAFGSGSVARNQWRRRSPLSASVSRRASELKAVAASSGGAIKRADDWIKVSIARDNPKYDVDGRPSAFELDFLPPAGGSSYSGAVLFMHGFEQIPQDYQSVLERLAAGGLWVVAPVQPQIVPEDPILQKLGSGKAVLQEIVHADAKQVAGLLLTPGRDGRPKLNDVPNDSERGNPPLSAAGVAIPSLQGKQVGIAGHSLGGGLTWSIVQAFPGRFSRLAVMAPFPSMADPTLTPSAVIGGTDPATGKPFQPPGASLVLEGGVDILALAPLIDKDIYNPLEGLIPKPAATKYKFPLGTHTGYQDYVGVGNIIVKLPGGSLIVTPPEQVANVARTVGVRGRGEAALALKAARAGRPRSRVEFVSGLAGSTGVFTFPEPVEDAIAAVVELSPFLVYGVIIALLLLISKVTGDWADAGGLLALLWRIISTVTFWLVPFGLFEVFIYAPFVQRPQTVEMIGNFVSVEGSGKGK